VKFASALLPVTMPGTVMDVEPWLRQLFSEGDLADYPIDRWKSFQSDVKSAKRRRAATAGFAVAILCIGLVKLRQPPFQHSSIQGQTLLHKRAVGRQCDVGAHGKGPGSAHGK